MVRLNFSVRNGKRWDPHAITTLVSLYSPTAMPAGVMVIEIIAGNAAVPWRCGREPSTTLCALSRTQRLHSDSGPTALVCFCLGERISHRKSSRVISTTRLRTLPPVHLPPINVVVFNDPQWKSYLVAGFVLRCFQHLSVPDAATRPCPGRDNRFTGGRSITVLSY